MLAVDEMVQAMITVQSPQTWKTPVGMGRKVNELIEQVPRQQPAMKTRGEPPIAHPHPSQ